MDETVQLPPTRRRSSILPRRSVGPPIADSQICGDNTSKPTETITFELQCPSEIVEWAGKDSHLQSSIQELTTEQNKWLMLRSERKVLKNRHTTPPQLSWETAHEFLCDEDIALLKNAPPHEMILQDYDRLVKEIAHLRIQYDRCGNLSSRTRDLVQARLNTIKRDIGEYSENNLDL